MADTMIESTSTPIIGHKRLSESGSTPPPKRRRQSRQGNRRLGSLDNSSHIIGDDMNSTDSEISRRAMILSNGAPLTPNGRRSSVPETNNTHHSHPAGASSLENEYDSALMTPTHTKQSNEQAVQIGSSNEASKERNFSSRQHSNERKYSRSPSTPSTADISARWSGRTRKLTTKAQELAGTMFYTSFSKTFDTSVSPQRNADDYSVRMTSPETMQLSIDQNEQQGSEVEGEVAAHEEATKQDEKPIDSIETTPLRSSRRERKPTAKARESDAGPVSKKRTASPLESGRASKSLRRSTSVNKGPSKLRYSISSTGKSFENGEEVVNISDTTATKEQPHAETADTTRDNKRTLDVVTTPEPVKANDDLTSTAVVTLRNTSAATPTVKLRASTRIRSAAKAAPPNIDKTENPATQPKSSHMDGGKHPDDVTVKPANCDFNCLSPVARLLAFARIASDWPDSDSDDDEDIDDLSLLSQTSEPTASFKLAFEEAFRVHCQCNDDGSQSLASQKSNKQEANVETSSGPTKSGIATRKATQYTSMPLTKIVILKVPSLKHQPSTPKVHLRRGTKRQISGGDINSRSTDPAELEIDAEKRKTRSSRATKIKDMSEEVSSLLPTQGRTLSNDRDINLKESKHSTSSCAALNSDVTPEVQTDILSKHGKPGQSVDSEIAPHIITETEDAVLAPKPKIHKGKRLSSLVNGNNSDKTTIPATVLSDPSPEVEATRVPTRRTRASLLQNPEPVISPPEIENNPYGPFMTLKFRDISRRAAIDDIIRGSNVSEVHRRSTRPPKPKKLDLEHVQQADVASMQRSPRRNRENIKIEPVLSNELDGSTSRRSSTALQKS